MKPKLYESGASFGKNELSSDQQANQNYLQLNYQFKFRYLNENAQPTVDKTMEPIDLSIKRTTAGEDARRKLLVEPKSKEIDKQNGVKPGASQAPAEHRPSQHSPTNSNSNNEAKLLPYLLLSNHPTSPHKPDDHQHSKTGQLDEPSSTYVETDLSLKYNKKKLFLASVRKRKQSSSTDNSNLSTNGAAFSSSSSSSSNSPNSTPSSSHTSATHQLGNSDRRNSSSSTTSSTNISSSPISDTNLNDDLDHQQPIKEFDLYQAQRNLLSKEKLFDSRLYSLPNSFAKKFEYFAKHYKLNESRGHKANGATSNGSNNGHSSANAGSHPLNGRSPASNPVNSSSNTSTNGRNMTNNGVKDSKPANRKSGNGSPQPNDKPANGSIRDNFSFFNMYLKSFQKCNSNGRTFIGLKRSLSESYLMDQKQEITLNLLTYKRRQLKRWNSENDLIDLYRCNRGEQSPRQNDQTKKEETSNRPVSRAPNGTTNRQANGQTSNGRHHQPIGKEQQLADYRQRKLDEAKAYENEMQKRQLIDKQISKEQEFYLRDQQHMKEDLVTYTKMLIRNNPKSPYPLNQFAHFSSQIDKFGQFNKFGDEFDKFNAIKPGALPLNLQLPLNRSKASLTFNNSQLFSKKPLINGQCSKINEKTGKRKFTKLASDEDEEDLEEDDENEENIIVDNLSNSASTSVSPSSIQSNSDSSINNNKLLLAKHHLDQHGENGLDLRLPYLSHPSHHLANHLNSLSRRPLPGSRQSGFGSLPNDLLQSEAASLTATPKDDLTSWKFYKDYYYLLLNQPDSPAKLNALQWLMKDLNEKNNNHVHLNDDWSELEMVKLHAYKPPYPTLESAGGPLNLTMFNGLNRPANSGVVLDQSHRQLLNTSRLDKFTPNSSQAINLANMQLTSENYLQYVKMNESLLNGNRHLTNGNQLQILTGQSYLNLENGSNHCLPAGTPNSFQGKCIVTANLFEVANLFSSAHLDRKRISRPLTGRHVRQGTGASPTTLATLRSMLKERQFREINGGLGENGKKSKKKRK